MDIVTRFLADTTQMKSAEQTVKKVGTEAEKTGEKVKKLGSNMRLTKGPTSALSTTAGQLGVQFQDVAVQAEAGTDAVRIFSQQGPQILSVFGPQGAVAGALLAIGLVVGKTIVDAFGLGKDAAEEFANNTKKVAGSVDTLTDDFFGLSESLVDLAQKSEVAARLQIALALEAADIAAKNAKESFKELGLEGSGMFRSLEDSEQGARDLLVSLDEIRMGSGNTAAAISVMKRASAELGISLDEIRNLGQSFVEAIDPNAEASALTAFSDKLGEIAETSGDPAFQQLALDFVQMALEAQSNEEKARLLETALEDLQSATKGTSQETINFVKNLEEQAEAIGKTREQILALQAADIQDDDLRARAEQAIKLIEFEAQAKEEARRAEKAANEARREEAKKQREIEKQQREEERAANKQKREELRAQREAEREAARERRRQFQEDIELRQIEDEQRRKADREFEEREKKIAAEKEAREKYAMEQFRRREEEKRRIQATAADAVLALEDKLLRDKSEKQKAAFRMTVNLLNEERRMNAMKIVSDSYAAAMGAYKALAGIPIIGPVLGAAAAGTIIAAGVAYAGRSLAGRALGGQVREGESYVVGERGPEVLTMGSNGRITPNDKLGGGAQQVVNRNINVSFQISTVDARGFDSLLQSRKGQIIGMINTAMNERGSRGLT